MGTVPFAFSVHHFINSVGADAGFASIIGLAILVLLYFAQARETATLREQAYEWAQRVQQLEGRIAQLTRQQPPTMPPTGPGATQAGRTGAPVVPAPLGIGAPARAGAAVGPGAPAGTAAPAPAHAPATAAAAGGIGGATRAMPTPVPSPAASGLPGAPAGVGAPALTAATKLIPSGRQTVAEPGQANASEQPRDDITIWDRPSGSPAAGRAPGAAPVPAAAAAGAAASAAASAASAPAAPAPATAAGAANGSSAPRPFGVTGAPTQAPAAEPIAAPPPRIQIGPSGQTATGRRQTIPPRQPPRGQPQPDGSSPTRRVLAGLLVLLVIGAVVAALVLLTKGSGSNSSASQSTTAARNATTTQHQHRAKASSGVTPSSVTVAVLNGTATAQLAHKIATKLSGLGYKQGNVATAADQTRTSTVVAYMPGARRDALAVASALKLGSASVQPIDQSTQAVCATPPSTTCAANVVVTAGSDLANTP